MEEAYNSPLLEYGLFIVTPSKEYNIEREGEKK